MTTPYALRTPCRDCPFRSDKHFPLGATRAQEIADSLTRDGHNFHCHKTVDYTHSPAGQIADRTKVCAGAVITMEKSGTVNQLTQIAERLGLYDPSAMNMDAPVYSSLQEWVEAQADQPST